MMTFYRSLSEFQRTFFAPSEGVSVWAQLKLGKHVAIKMPFTVNFLSESFLMILEPF